MFCLTELCTLKTNHRNKFAYRMYLVATPLVLSPHIFSGFINDLPDLLFCRDIWASCFEIG